MLTFRRNEVAREYVRENLFNPFTGDLIYNGVIIRSEGIPWTPEELAVIDRHRWQSAADDLVVRGE